MTVEATILRVVGYILSLPVESRSREANRLQRYARLYRTKISADILTQIEEAQFATLYQQLFPLVHQHAMSAESPVYDSPSVVSPFVKGPAQPVITDDALATGNDSSSEVSEDESATQTTLKEESTDEPNLSTEQANLSESQVTETASDASVSMVESGAEVPSVAEQNHSDDVQSDADTSVAVESPESPESEESVWPQKLRMKLLKRFRSPRSKRSPRPHHEKNSRWEFWHANVGLCSLNDWLGQSILDEVSQTIFSQTIEQLVHYEIGTIGNLLLQPPVEYEKFPFSTLDRSIVEGTTTLRGKIVQKFIEIDPVLKRWTIVLEGKDAVEMSCSWAGNAPRGWERWSVGATIGLVGHVDIEDGLEMRNPEPIGLDGRGSGLLPKYDLDGISNQEVRNLIAYLIQTLGTVQDSLPKDIVEVSDILSLEDALREAHFPSNQNYKGRSRLAFEEVFLYHVGKRLNSKFVASNGVANVIHHKSLAQYSWIQNIQLSDEQEVVLSDIRREMLSSEPMRRLLQGDVGSGKPMVALFAALSLFDLRKPSKGKSPKKPLVVYLCDDELSAERRFGFVEGAFKMLGIQCKLLTHKPSKAEYSILESDGGMVVVTSEILKTRLQSLGNIRLVIVEENHNFGSNIPYGFIKRSPSPDLLVFTPTPQPIHILETVYADFALSTISVDNRVLPNTRCVKAEEREPVYGKLLDLVNQGRQGMIVWPVVNGKDSIDVKQALQMASAIQGRYLPDVRMAVYCSSMRTEERLKVFEAYQNKRIDVLLCTTIIEDTPTVGNSTMIIVEKAEVSDLMRLHRLRGHLSNSHYPSECVYVLSDDADDEAVELVERVCDQSDGSELAEWLADDKAGLEFRWATQADVLVRMKARKLAHKLALRDLRRCRWPLLNNAVRNWWEEFEVPEHTKTSNNRRRYNKKRGRK